MRLPFGYRAFLAFVVGSTITRSGQELFHVVGDSPERTTGEGGLAPVKDLEEPVD
jgi:hypothetical protein